MSRCQPGRPRAASCGVSPAAPFCQAPKASPAQRSTAERRLEDQAAAQPTSSSHLNSASRRRILLVLELSFATPPSGVANMVAAAQMFSAVALGRRAKRRHAGGGRLRRQADVLSRQQPPSLVLCDSKRSTHEAQLLAALRSAKTCAAARTLPRNRHPHQLPTPKSPPCGHV